MDLSDILDLLKQAIQSATAANDYNAVAQLSGQYCSLLLLSTLHFQLNVTGSAKR